MKPTQIELCHGSFDFDTGRTTYTVADHQGDFWKISCLGQMTFKKIDKGRVLGGFDADGEPIMRDARIVDVQDIIAESAVHAVRV